ncbi:MAG: hypothetical protein ABMB14_01440, partial [Myxococcota bacterium]
MSLRWLVRVEVGSGSAAIACVAALAGCTGGEPSPEGGPGTTIPTSIPPTSDPVAPCAPALAIAPAEAYAVPFGLAQLVGTGGTGAYRWSVPDGATGAVDPGIGGYVAGADAGRSETVTLTDLGCAGAATAEVHVVDPLAVLPERATVLPGTAFDPEVHGGSGTVSCALAAGTTGSTLAGCTYTAGAAPGTDVLTVVDAAIDASVDLVITVDPAATMTVTGTERWFVPLGSTFRPTVAGGSGIVDVVPRENGVVTPIDGGLDAVGAGRVTVDLTDRFAGFTAAIEVSVVAPVAPPTGWVGLRSNVGAAAWAGDLDGDGFDDAVVGFYELSVAATNGGAALVYRGGPDGFDPAPVQTLTGAGRFESFGRAILVADLDGDGLDDLAVGADGA